MSSIASVAANQAAAAAASGNAKTSSSALDASSLSTNMNTFLNLLMTQLQNQDPTSPLDTSQFTSQLVQYSSVEQQIKTNSSLTNLIQLTQGSEVVQSSALLKRTVEVASDHLSLLGGKAQAVDFKTTAAAPVSIVVTDASGNQVANANLTAAAGRNAWTWDGAAGGGDAPDGLYKVLVTQANPDGTSTALDTSVVGPVTGVTATGGVVTIDMDALQVDFSKLQSVQY